MFEPKNTNKSPSENFAGQPQAGSSTPAPFKKKFKPKRSALSDCNYSLHQVLKEHNHLVADGGKKASYATSRARKDILTQCFKSLHEGGFKIRNVYNLNSKHISYLVKRWESESLSASTIQSRVSALRVFCGWIGKNGMVRGAEEYLENPEVAKRVYVATQDNGWVAKGIEILSKIKEVMAKDIYVGIQLLAMWAFGLRAREAWQFHPKAVDLQMNVVPIYWGAKNGRKREVPIRNPWQRLVVEMAMRHANDSTGSLIPSDYTRVRWKDHFYRVCRSCGIARANGYVPHGLRHEHANDLYEQLSGENSPVRGGATIVDECLHEIDAVVRLEVAKELGHARPQIVGAYCGKKPRKKKID